MRTDRLGAVLAVLALSACAAAPRVEAPAPVPSPPARASAACASLAQRLVHGMPLVEVNASIGEPDAAATKLCGNAAAGNLAECLHATYACLGADGHPTELWVFYDRADGAWKVRYFGSHARTSAAQGAI